MRNRIVYQLVIVLMVVIVAGIVALQMFLYKQSLNTGERKFHQTVGIALHEVSHKVVKANHQMNGDTLWTEWSTHIVEKLSNNYYVVNINGNVGAKLLEQLLIQEFAKAKIDIDFEFAIYDCSSEKMVYGNYISATDGPLNPDKDDELPQYDGFTYYFGVFFPNRSNYFNSELKWWYFFSALLVFIVLFFGYSMWIILKHRRLSETQRHFINNITHEFKTPLASLGLAADVLASNDILKEEQRLKQYASIVKKQTEHLREMTERVLESTLAGHNQIQMQLQQIDLSSTLKDIVNNYSLNDSAQIEIKIPVIKTQIIADKNHFEQVVFNLIDNAVKYSENKPVITIHMERMKHHYLLSISDNGIGIPLIYQRKIFKKFYRIPTGNIHNVKGFGLGLSYVKNICRLHKWTITIKSKELAGSTFTIKIPMKQ